MGAHCNILLRIIELCKVPKLFAYKPVSCHNVPLLVMNGALLTTMVETIRVLLWRLYCTVLYCTVLYSPRWWRQSESCYEDSPQPRWIFSSSYGWNWLHCSGPKCRPANIFVTFKIFFAAADLDQTLAFQLDDIQLEVAPEAGPIKLDLATETFHLHLMKKKIDFDDFAVSKEQAGKNVFWVQKTNCELFWNWSHSFNVLSSRYFRRLCVENGCL